LVFEYILHQFKGEKYLPRNVQPWMKSLRNLTWVLTAWLCYLYLRTDGITLQVFTIFKCLLRDILF